MTAPPLNWFLVVAGGLSAIASMLHVAIIFGGQSWYRFFGAGHRMASMAAAGDWYPPVITAGISAVLAIWSVYAFSGAGLVRPLPLLQAGLVAITAIYLMRGLMIVPLLLDGRGKASAFWWWSSIICMGYAAIHLAGLAQSWDRL